MTARLGCLAVLLLAGCATDVCQHRAEIGQDCDRPLSDTELAACDDALATCSGDERQRLKTLYACLEEHGYADCDRDAEFAGPGLHQVQALLACEDKANRISASCLEATGRTALTTFEIPD